MSETVLQATFQRMAERAQTLAELMASGARGPGLRRRLGLKTVEVPVSVKQPDGNYWDLTAHPMTPQEQDGLKRAHLLL